MVTPTLGRIWTMRQDGTDIRTVREFGGLVWGARWSPDGQYIAFYDQTQADGFFHRLMVMDADGGNLRALAWGGSVEGLSWHPDSRHLLYVRYGVHYPQPGSPVYLRDGFFHVVDTVTGAMAFSAAAGTGGAYTQGCACGGSYVTQPRWRGAQDVVYNTLEQTLPDPNNPAAPSGSKLRVRSLAVSTLPALDVPLSGIGRVGEGDNVTEQLAEVDGELGVLLKVQRNDPGGAPTQLVWVRPGGSRSVLVADGGGRPFSWSPDRTLCRWGEDFHTWANFDPVGNTSRVGPAPLAGQHWYLAA
jgi:hypothetical protein